MWAAKKHHALTITQIQKTSPSSLVAKPLIAASRSVLESVPKSLQTRLHHLWPPSESPPLQWRPIFKPRQPAEQNATYWEKTRGQKTVPEQTRLTANLKLKSERTRNTQPALRNCQQKTLGCQLLLLNWAVMEAKEQRSPSCEAKMLASKRGGYCK